MKLLILGAGEYGQLVKELARNKYATIDFLDDNSAAAIGKISDLEKYKGEYHAIVAIGNPEKRKELFDKLVVLGINIPTIVSDKAYISPSAEIEQGCVIEPMAIINTGAKISCGKVSDIHLTLGTSEKALYINTSTAFRFTYF